MNNKNMWIGGIIFIMAVSIGFLLFQKKETTTIIINEPDQEEVVTVRDERTPTEPICVGEYCDGSMESDDYLEKYTVLQIPLITDGGNLGCGAKLFFAPHAVPKTTGVMDATYQLLFNLKPAPEIMEDGFRNVVGVYTQLFYDSVTLNNGVAKLYLSGTMYGPGHCAEPELRAQIEQAALQFATVEKLEVYLNNEVFNWCSMDMSDGEGPCPENPQYWIVNK